MIDSNDKNFHCPHCEKQIKTQKVLEFLVPQGYKTCFRVREKETGKMLLLWFDQINPELYEVIEE